MLKNVIFAMISVILVLMLSLSGCIDYIEEMVGAGKYIESFDISKDGERIVYCVDKDHNMENYEIWIMDISGRNHKRIASDLKYSRDPSLHPDGNKVVFVHSFDLFSFKDPIIYEIWEISFDEPANNIESLVSEQSEYLYPQYNHDGSRIYYIKHSDESWYSDEEVWYFDKDLGEEICVLNSSIYSFKIIDTTILFTNSSGIWLCDIDGMNPTKLTDDVPSHSGQIDLSPDKTKIVYSSTAAGREFKRNSDEWTITDIWLMDIDSKERTQLTSYEYDTFSPVFTSDGKHILFLGKRDIWRMDIDGNNCVKIAS